MNTTARKNVAAAGIKNGKKPPFAALKINKKSIYFMQIYFTIGCERVGRRTQTHTQREKAK